MKIDGLVAQIISAANFDNFTTGDVRSFYNTLKNDPTLQPATTRRKIYAELLKLVKKGWLKKKSLPLISSRDLVKPTYLRRLN